MADIVDFTFVLAGGEILRKSELPSDQWKQFCPVERMEINGHVYPLFAKDVVDVYVEWQGRKIRVRTKPHWGAYRFFVHHNGVSFMGQGVGAQTGTTFGVIYTDYGSIHKFTFTTDGNMEPSVEVFAHVEPVV